MSAARALGCVLVANRGEIARRVLRTCRELGLRTVAVYSTADAGAAHVREADQAVCIGPAPARESYLSIEALVTAARATGARAVHPGYGFLSESAAFARALEAAGIVFVGPPAEVLEASADKLEVKRRVAEAGVPVIPGPLEALGTDPAALEAAARATGYPLLLKAVAGGGGKGMRRVADPAGLAEAAAGARREAGGAFGATGLYLERLLEGARHVEVQVLCDAQGHGVVLGERDCSLQRRHQKVLEESPAPGLDPKRRALLWDAGRAAARALGYRGAGTVEFLLEPSGAIHFLEVNRRLQVEHPVTEACFGVDLVAWQLRLAAGEALPPQAAFASRGHAVEARVYAEDPAAGFLPSVGRVAALSWPAGPGLRVDAGVEEGEEVTPHYDPLLAKVIAHGASRGEALDRLALALEETVVLGVRTNVGFLGRLVRDADVRAARLSTQALEGRLEDLARAPAVPDEVLLAVAAFELLGGAGGRAGGAAGAPGPAATGRSPWDELTGWRPAGNAP